jgi:hypothetical protein
VQKFSFSFQFDSDSKLNIVARNMKVKMAVFWDVAPCSLVEVTDVSEVLASIIRAMSELLGFLDSKGFESLNAVKHILFLEVY